MIFDCGTSIEIISFLSHLLVAGCDIGVRISAYPSVNNLGQV